MAKRSAYVATANHIVAVTFRNLAPQIYTNELLPQHLIQDGTFSELSKLYSPALT